MIGFRRISCGLALLALTMSVDIPVLAAGQKISYAGRMTDLVGRAITGPVTLKVRFFDDAQVGSQLGADLDITGVTLVDGLFQVELDLTPTDSQLVFGSAGDVWIEVKDVTHNKVMPRQKFSAVPYALNVPIDDNTLGYTADGKLTLSAPPQNGMFLSSVSGHLQWQTLPGGGNMSTGTYDDALGSVTGVVDDSEKLGGFAASHFLNASNISAGTLADARIPAAIARDSEIPASTDVLAEGATNKYATAAEKTKLAGIEALADVTDATNVAAAGAVMDSDFSAVGMMKRTGAGAYTIVTDSSANWNTAYGWGNHGVAGYLTSVPWAAPTAALGSTTPVAGTFTALQANTTFKLKDADTNLVTIQSPAIAADYTLTLPTTNGSANEVLKTDGNGVLSWVAQPVVDSSSVDSTGAVMDGDFGSNGLMKRTALGTYAVVTDSSANWNTAYGWGNHGVAGYLTSVPWAAPTAAVGSTTPVAGTFTALQANTTLKIKDADTNLVTIQSPAIGADYTLTLPTTDGNANEVLKTDGSGALAWVAQSSVDSSTVDAAGAVMNSDISSNGIVTRTGAGVYAAITDNSTNWNTAHTDRLKWDGGATGLVQATARTSLGLVPGTDVQAYDAGLQSIAGLTTAANQMIYTTGSDVYATTALTSFGRDLLDDGSVAAQRTTLGLGTMATQAASAVAITGGTLTDVTLTTPAIANDAISGDKIDGGTISNFASTGIDDNASANAMTILSSGKVGIGVASPATALEVGGAIRIGTQATCTAAEAGAMRYTGGVFQGCDGSTWTTFAAGATEAGTVRLFAQAAPPTGWLACDGSAVSRTTYASLFAAISTNYGVGDGSTTFNLPRCATGPLMVRPTGYRYYRLRIKSMTDNSSRVIVRELRFHWNNTWQRNAMTAAATGTIGGYAATVSSATVNGGYAAWQAFTNNQTDYYETSTAFGGSQPFDETTPHWIKVDFGAGNAPVITGYDLNNEYAGGARSGDAFELEGSTNDSTWTVIPGSAYNVDPTYAGHVMFDHTAGTYGVKY